MIREIHKAIEHVVDLMNLDGANLKYHFEYPKGVQKRLSNQAKDADQKVDIYPLIILRPGYTEVFNNSEKDYLVEASVSVLIATKTDPNWSTSERDTNTFEPILNPLYWQFMYTLQECNLFDLDGKFRIKNERIKHYFYSSTEAKEQNVYAAYWDAVEINNLELKLMKQRPDECAPIPPVTQYVYHNGEIVTHNGENVTHTF